jgi:hypothetical protein
VEADGSHPRVNTALAAFAERFSLEEVAMLLFYLPIIIFEAMFEAMFEANENKRKAGDPTAI